MRNTCARVDMRSAGPARREAGSSQVFTNAWPGDGDREGAEVFHVEQRRTPLVTRLAGQPLHNQRRRSG